MTKGKKLAVAVLTPLLLGGLLLVAQPGSSQAAEEVAAQDSRPVYGQGLRMGIQGGMPASLSKLLGLDPDTLRTERRAGNSIADIAAARGIDKQTVVDTIMTERQQMIEERVAAGRMTREQADFCRENMEQRISQNIQRTTVGPNGNGQDQRDRKAGAADGSGQGQGQGIRAKARDGSGAGQGFGRGFANCLQQLFPKSVHLSCVKRLSCFPAYPGGPYSLGFLQQKSRN